MNQQTKIKDFIAVTSFVVLFIIGSWALLYSLQTQSAELSSEKSLIVLSSFHGYFPGALLGVMFMLGYAATRLWQGIFNKPVSSNNGKVTAIGLLGSILLIIIGNFVVNSYWTKKAEYAAYQVCPAMTLLTNRVTMEVWVKNEALCYDRDVRRIISRGTPA
ncbi:hypothetical protein VT06_16675, partial [Arsukibacterium sp. MJ3]|uniref:hypothetical protein n=1 Tax=Arsukibacterium sp. MJ3 TaxID=1632859 RepID=UPI00062726CB